MSFRFDTQGLAVTRDKMTLTHRWSAIRDIRVSFGVLLVIYDEKLAYAIPLAAIDDNGQWQRIEALAQRKFAGQASRP